MSVACRSTCRPTIGQHSRSTYRPPYRSSVSRHIDRRSTDMSADISVDISTDTRPICRPTYRWTLGRYVDRYVRRLSVEGCTKYTWSKKSPITKRAMQRMWDKISYNHNPCTWPTVNHAVCKCLLAKTLILFSLLCVKYIFFWFFRSRRVWATVIFKARL